jgi:hypothetical protein
MSLEKIKKIPKYFVSKRYLELLLYGIIIYNEPHISNITKSHIINHIGQL